MVDKIGTRDSRDSIIKSTVPQWWLCSLVAKKLKPLKGAKNSSTNKTKQEAVRDRVRFVSNLIKVDELKIH